ncbi:hypothetical protein KI387_022319, partial [Taxus chinensis]
HERDLAKQHEIVERMFLGRDMDRERFRRHMEDVELEHMKIPHLRKNGRETSSVLDESTYEERLRTVGAHLILPGDLALALGVLTPEIVIENLTSVGVSIAI